MSSERVLDEWADKYGELRASGPGSIRSLLAIPLIVGSLIGMLWAAPTPSVLQEASPAINLATLFLLATFVYYCILSISLGFGGFLFLVIVSLPSVWLSQAGLPLAKIASSLFLVTFLWQSIETRHATGSLRAAQNLQYLMIGPIWILRAAYRKLGIAY